MNESLRYTAKRLPRFLRVNMMRELETENHWSRLKPGQAAHCLDPFAARFDSSIPMTAIGNDK